MIWTDRMLSLIGAGTLALLAGTGFAGADGIKPGAGPQLIAPDDPSVARSRIEDASFAPFTNLADGSRFDVALFEGAQVSAVLNRVERRADGRVVARGYVDGHFGSSVLLTVHDGLMSGIVESPWFGTVTIGASAAGQRLVAQIDHSKYSGCGGELPAREVDPAVAGGTVNAPRAACNDDGSIIDVLVLWTVPARNGAGGTAAIQNQIVLAVERANDAYNASQINTQLNLVHMEETDYTEFDSYGGHLGRLASTVDGEMDDVHALRDATGADMVDLFVQDGTYCGIAYLMTNLSPGFASSAFSVTTWYCAVGNRTFAHELGHNQGCAHDRGNAGGALFGFSYGWRFNGNSGTQYRTVMSYAPGSRIGNFSNPDVNFDGQPTGVSGSEDNAQSINLAAETIANFRCYQDCNDNGINDPDDIAAETSEDCNDNLVPDECEQPLICNDICSGSFYLAPGGPHAFSTINATTDGPVEANPCDTIGSDVWYVIVGECDGPTTIDICDADYDAAVSVYGGGCPSDPGELIACGNDGCAGGNGATLTFDTQTNSVYRLRVGGNGGAQGSGMIMISCGTPDQCPGDTNGDNAVNTDDFLSVLGNWGNCPAPCPPACTGDTNDDCNVNTDDFLAVLGNWGPCVAP